MNGPILWLAAAAAALLGIACIALFLERSRLRARASSLEARTVGLEARLQEAQARAAGARSENAPAAQGKQRKETRDDSQRREELMSLRRDVAHARDEARKAGAEARAKELEVREAREKAEGALHSLREENKRLIEQMREMERSRPTQASSAQATQAARAMQAPHPMQAPGTPQAVDPMRGANPTDAPSHRVDSPEGQAAGTVRDTGTARDALEIRELRRELAQARARMAEFERRDARDDARVKETQAKLADVERELRRYREAAALEGGRPLDPVAYVRWRDRALEGRRMYRMMRQLRDLSDLKLASYQASIERLALAFLSSKGASTPSAAGPGIARADSLLRAALECLPPPVERPESALPDDGSVSSVGIEPVATVTAATVGAPAPAHPAPTSP